MLVLLPFYCNYYYYIYYYYIESFLFLLLRLLLLLVYLLCLLRGELRSNLPSLLVLLNELVGYKLIYTELVLVDILFYYYYYYFLGLDLCIKSIWLLEFILVNGFYIFLGESDWLTLWYKLLNFLVGDPILIFFDLLVDIISSC